MPMNSEEMDSLLLKNGFVLDKMWERFPWKAKQNDNRSLSQQGIRQGVRTGYS